MRTHLKIAWPVAALALVACTSVVPYRTELEKTCNQEAVEANCSKAAFETYRDFDVAYVEFTDQGWLHDRNQLTRTLDLLRKPDPRPLQIVVFVHGWKHDAKFDDRDVRAFRETVMPAMARNQPNSRTVGVYVGWRGASLNLPSLAQSISFYDRKSTADHVARGSVRELFSYLRTMRNKTTAGQVPSLSITLIGHSFGGLILYNSITESLMDSLVVANSGDPSEVRLAKPVFDLVVLLNPAFEATRFEPLFQVAKEHLLPTGSTRPYGKDQRPIFVSITSEGDSATRIAFPISRYINSTFQHEGWTDQDDRTKQEYAQRLEKIANNHTIGHMERYRTHRLTLTGDGQSAKNADKKKIPITCALVHNALFAKESPFPLWTMHAAADVIESHHDIYGENLWAFISQLRNSGPSIDRVCG